MSASESPKRLAQSRRIWGFDENMVFIGAPCLSLEEAEALLPNSESSDSEESEDWDSDDWNSEEWDSEDADYRDVDYGNKNSNNSEV